MEQEPRFLALLPSTVPLGAKVAYWRELLEADLLKYRLADIYNPTLDHALWLDSRFKDTIFYCFDKNEGRICGEMTLDGLNGASSRVHFSVLPYLRGEPLIDATLTLHRFVFSLKRQPSPDNPDQIGSHQPYVQTLVGVTPVSNRLAVRFIQKVGFRPLGVIPKAVDLKYKGIIDDGLLSIKTSENNNYLNGGEDHG